MPELGKYGSVRGVPSNGHPYRDQNWAARPDAPVAARRPRDETATSCTVVSGRGRGVAG
jgi:hypothetical protein